MRITNLYKEKEHIQKVDSSLHMADGEVKIESSELLCEHLIKVFINEKEAMNVVCTGNHLVELVVGRMLSEGIVKSLDEIEEIYICEEGLRAKVFLKETKVDGNFIDVDDVSSCCQDNKSYIKGKYKLERINKILDVKDRDVFNLAKAFSEDSKIHKTTQGTHTAYLYHNGRVIVSFEDIGRHNALDKVIGYLYLNNFVSEECIIFTTGRVPLDMARKAIRIKIGSLVSKAVPTKDAIELAKEYNLNLICRAWQDSFQIYNQAV